MGESMSEPRGQAAGTAIGRQSNSPGGTERGGKTTATLVLPALAAAVAFACTDILSKVAMQDGAGVMTTSTARGVLGVILMALWGGAGRLLWRCDKHATGRSPPPSTTAVWISLGLGVIFAANLLLLFMAIGATAVPIAIATYFVYPLLTGIVGAALGLDRLSWRGALAALVALAGLSVMVGAGPGDLALVGIGAAVAAACCRVAMLLITRATLAGVDAGSITWYSMLSSTALLGLILVVAGGWQPPATALGWGAICGLGVATTIGILAVYASTGLIGPFHTALIMNLEPLLTTIGSALFLGEILTAPQAAGCATMLIALAAFQIWR